MKEPLTAAEEVGYRASAARANYLGVEPSGPPVECEGAVHNNVHPDPSRQAHVVAARTQPGRETKARAVIQIPRRIVENRFFFDTNKIHIVVFC